MTNNKSKEINNSIQKNNLIMKILVVLGVIVLSISLVYLMNYFFVEKSYIKINMSTDKKLEYVTINGKEELISTQKYVSDLNYTMRYDINKFSVFKYKLQDIYRYKDDERILVVVEKSPLPNACTQSSLDMAYNNCKVKIDNYTDEYYISTNGKTYKITIKTSNGPSYTRETKELINYMINSFEMVL